MNRTTGFTPYELQTGRAMPGPQGKVAGAAEVEAQRSHRQYFYELQNMPSVFSKQVTCREGESPEHTVPGADWVLLKVIKRKWSEPRWTGLYQVVERTSHAVWLQGKGETWYHWSQCAEAAEPDGAPDSLSQGLKASAGSVKVPLRPKPVGLEKVTPDTTTGAE